MRCFILLSLLATFLFSCSSDSQKAKDKQHVKSKDRVERVSKPQNPTLNVYNMGGVPAKDVDDSAYIKDDPKGKNRYWWSKLRPHLIKTTDTKRGLTLVIVNAEVCNWDAKAKGSHANLGMSNCGGHVSTISYQRLKVNHLNNVNDMMKVVIHELGHSVARLVIEREDLRFHCPNVSCLMKDANNGFPYRGLTSFCPSCSKAMKTKGFNLSALKLKE